MSSSPCGSPTRFFRSSSPGAGDIDEYGGGRRRSSRFTYRQLSQLAACATSCPLRVIAHIDLDAFYAQCEMVRLGVDPDQPLACQQWQGLIAVNYPARKFGIGRFCTIEEAKKLCPNLMLAHVATWREGDETWAYHDDIVPDVAKHKVSLDPYRTESRKILALIKECLPAHQRKVEKASIDEVFIDLSANVHTILLERFPELAMPPLRDDPTEHLPPPPVSALDWQADALVDLDEGEAEADDPDWDDVAILIGSEIVRGIRRAILEKLHYTCSAGVASNKMLSKLGSGHRKPNQQTVIRNRATQHFLSGIKFTKIRMLGGKLGEQVAEAFGTEELRDLLPVPLEQLQARLGEETGAWVYGTVRGVDNSDVIERTQIKSMLSAKAFRPSVGSLDQAVRWLRIFAADIFSRLVEEGALDGGRRPKTLTVHHLRLGERAARSRSCPIPQGGWQQRGGGAGAGGMGETVLFELARGLLVRLVEEEGAGRAWPCSNLSINVSGFEEGVTGNMGIGGFLVKGEEAVQVTAAALASTGAGAGTVVGHQSHPPDYKRRRTNHDGGIQRFFAKRGLPGGNDVFGPTAATASPSTTPLNMLGPESSESGREAEASPCITTTTINGMPPLAKEEGGGRKRSLPREPDAGEAEYDNIGQRQQGEPITETMTPSVTTTTATQCPRCGLECGTLDELQSHQDWHLARDLQDEEERGAATFAGADAGSGGLRHGPVPVLVPAASSSRRAGGKKTASSSSTASSSRRSRVAAAEPGQSRLKFG